jgi:type IV pilus assembly protein PilV
MSQPTRKSMRRLPANRPGYPGRRPMTLAGRAAQSGVMLLEALIGIGIFSIGILALVAMQAAAINAVADSQYRVEAVNQANQLLSQIWMGVDRTNPTNLQNSLLKFAHQTGGTPASCDFTGAPAQNAIVQEWADQLNGVSASHPALPGSTDAMQQVVISTGASNRVTITVCWRAPNAAATAPSSRHTLIAYIN